MAEIRIAPGFAGHSSLVRLRVAMPDAGRAAAQMQLPTEPLRWAGTDPAALWVSPDQWLLAGATGSPEQLLRRCEVALGDIVYHATDASDALICIVLEGAGVRRLLAMLSGVDCGATRLRAGQCVRTRMAKVAVLVRAMDDDRFELFVDRSIGEYVECWLLRCAQDPIFSN